MTDNPTEPTDAPERVPWDEESDPDGYTSAELRAKDIYLDVLLTFMVGSDDQGSGAIGLTVQLNGSLVSGIAISRKAWMDSTLETLTSSAGESLGGPLGSVFNLINDRMLDKRRERDAANLPLRPHGFIHMRDVQVTVGGAKEHYSLPLWRGSVADITGWSLGSWNPREEPAPDATYAD